jgi:hypothetical protein
MISAYNERTTPQIRLPMSNGMDQANEFTLMLLEHDGEE